MLKTKNLNNKNKKTKKSPPFKKKNHRIEEHREASK
jgi:hypothetical protein